MRSSSALVAGVLLLVAAPARAGEEDAKSFFAEGRTLRAEHRCDDAIVRFRRALEVYPEGLGSLRNVAECEEELGRFAAARRDWWDLRRAVMQSNEAKYDGWDKDAADRYARLASKVARMTVSLAGQNLERVRVVVDGKPFDGRLLGTELERDLGKHTVEAYYGGEAAVTKQIELREGQSVAVLLEIPGGSAAHDHGTAKPPETPPPSHAVQNAGFVALGVGAVGLAGLGIAAAVRSSALSDVKGACPSYETQACPADLKATQDRGKTAATVANVLGVVGAVGVVSGVTLLVVASRKPASPVERAASVRVRAAAAPGGGGASAEVRF